MGMGTNWDPIDPMFVLSIKKLRNDLKPLKMIFYQQLHYRYGTTKISEHCGPGKPIFGPKKA